jgi:hypothetical protein
VRATPAARASPPANLASKLRLTLAAAFNHDQVIVLAFEAMALMEQIKALKNVQLQGTRFHYLLALAHSEGRF